MSLQDEEVAAYTAVPLSNGNLEVAFTAVPLRGRHQASIGSSDYDSDYAAGFMYESDSSTGDSDSSTGDSRSGNFVMEYILSSIVSLLVLYFIFEAPGLVNFQEDYNRPVFIPPTQLTGENFTSYLAAHEHTFIHFHAPWNTCSEKLVPIWNEFQDEKKTYRDLRFMGAMSVNCTQEPILCRQQAVFSFPTLRWYKREALVSQVDLEEDRNVDALIGFAIARTRIRLPYGYKDAFAPCASEEIGCSSLPTYLTRDDFDAVLGSLQTAFVVFMKPGSSALSDSLARAWKYQDWTSRRDGIPARVFLVDCQDQKQLCIEHGIKELDPPTMLLFNHGIFEEPTYQAAFLDSEYGANGTCQS